MGSFITGQTSAMLFSTVVGIYIVQIFGNIPTLLFGVFLGTVMCCCAAFIPPHYTGTSLGVAILVCRTLGGFGDGLMQVCQ